MQMFVMCVYLYILFCAAREKWANKTKKNGFHDFLKFADAASNPYVSVHSQTLFIIHIMLKDASS